VASRRTCRSWPRSSRMRPRICLWSGAMHACARRVPWLERESGSGLDPATRPLPQRSLVQSGVVPVHGTGEALQCDGAARHACTSRVGRAASPRRSGAPRVHGRRISDSDSRTSTTFTRTDAQCVAACTPTSRTPETSHVQSLGKGNCDALHQLTGPLDRVVVRPSAHLIPQSRYCRPRDAHATLLHDHSGDDRR
jgi:hypothetical protein